MDNKKQTALMHILYHLSSFCICIFSQIVNTNKEDLNAPFDPTLLFCTYSTWGNMFCAILLFIIEFDNDLKLFFYVKLNIGFVIIVIDSNTLTHIQNLPRIRFSRQSLSFIQTFDVASYCIHSYSLLSSPTGLWREHVFYRTHKENLGIVT